MTDSEYKDILESSKIVFADDADALGKVDGQNVMLFYRPRGYLAVPIQGGQGKVSQGFFVPSSEVDIL